MRIAQVAPLFESVPPKLYGGTERVVSYLTEELVRQGHEVTLFASADSRSSARLRPMCDNGLRLSPCIDPVPHHALMIEKLLQEADDFDIVHFHIEFLHCAAFRRHKTPAVTTLHGRLDLPDLVPFYHEFRDMPAVSISNGQRLPLLWLNWRSTVYHGLPKDLFRFNPEPGKYLAFIGRIAPEKRPDRAVKIARALGVPLKVAAKVDRADQDYFDTVVKPLFDDPLVEFIGEIGDTEKSDFLGGAYALLFPIDWPEPFGLTMIEAMACGTPVIAFRCGSVPEIIHDGVTGFVVEDCAQAVMAFEQVGRLDRRAVRSTFEARFSVERMAEDYLMIYESLANPALAPVRIA
ncbi:glycosyltransferase family 4 protein [Rhodospirillaceae bacterium SYSU D60014]|uniref:glycosyltransferase family 4 protein n=1 Tax=Virgifigura deserti TaxID=2268457 RepID=UPI000E66CE24